MNDPVRVRYAPSPTGDPHLGNIRTALFNWLFARHHGGSFIVRIEDTDQQRYIPKAVPAILDALTWLGLTWDEGPSPDVSGDIGLFAPYKQSERLPYYHQVADELLTRGLAYHCYCTPERLTQMRENQRKHNLEIGYDGRCRTLSDAEFQRLSQESVSHVIRFKVPSEGITTVNDLIRGNVTWENKLLDDFVILKSDGFPTYHLGVVTDDHLMEISHVLRAEEWLPSTPKHLLLYHALKWTPPRFGHLPMLLGPDRSKLSKRHGATSTLAYRDLGFIPEATLNFLALLGWSLDDQSEILPRETVVSAFSLDRVNRAPAIFNIDKLSWMNGVYIRKLSVAALTDRLLPFLEQPASGGGLPDNIRRPIDRNYLRLITPLIQERIKTLAEGPAWVSLFLADEVDHDPAILVQKGMDLNRTKEILRIALQHLESLSSWEPIGLEDTLRTLANELGLKPGQMFGALRAATTGRIATPPLFQTLSVLGRNRSLDRLKAAAV
jgi:glutamyl-tRNA synthetase